MNKIIKIICLSFFILSHFSYAQNNNYNNCAILGDSIAFGLSTKYQYCYVNAQVGMNTEEYQNMITSINKKIVIISLGVNDSSQIDTYDNLLHIREKIKSKYVFWILPRNSHLSQQRLVSQVAKKFNDDVINVDQLASPDGVHPSSYDSLYSLVKNKTLWISRN